MLTDKTGSSPFFHTKGNLATYPLNSIQPGMYAVASVKEPDGVGDFTITNYRYENAMLHRGGRGFLGFQTIVAENSIADRKSISEFELILPVYTPVLKNNIITRMSGNLVSETTNTYHPLINLQNYKRFYHRLNTSTVKDHINNKETVTTINTSGYDAYNNVTDVITEFKALSGSTFEYDRVVTSYIQVNATPYPASPQYITNYKNRTEHGVTDADITYNQYYNNGLIYIQTQHFNKPCSLATAYSYDIYGNPTFVSYSSGGNTRTNAFTYDTRGRFITSRTNALNQTEYIQTHALWGKPTQITGIDGLVTQQQYDEWGRETTTIVKHGTTEQHNIVNSFVWDIQGGNHPSVYYTLTTNPGLPDNKSWYDILGRNTKTQTEWFNNNWITEYTRYDAKGNVFQTTDAEGLITTNTYGDVFGRLSQTSNSIKTIGYSYAFNGGGKGGLAVTVTNSSANPTQSKITKTDATGKITSVEENGATLNYEYFSHGGQRKVLMGSTKITEFAYDQCYKQTTLDDKNAGITTYKYTGFGDLEEQTDNQGNKYKMYYDNLGLLTKREGIAGNATDVTNYTYFGSGTGAKINQLNTVSGTGFNNTTFTYNYDAFGRLTTETTTINGQNYTHTYGGFNIYSDAPTTHEYPSGFKTETLLNNGFVTEIRNHALTSQKYFSVAMSNNSYNNYGQVKQYTLNNGLQSNMTYNYGHLTNKFTTGKQDYSLQYNYGSGNIINREEFTVTKYEDFTYDALSRLKTMQVNGGSSLSINYDNPTGNITSKFDAGTYTYDNNKIHAVTSVDNSANTISTNIQNITYTAYHQPATITENNYELTYGYGPDYQRKTMELKQGSTILQRRIYLGDFEIDATDLYNPKGIHYINSPAGLVAIVVQEGITTIPFTIYTDHLGSIVKATNASGGVVAEQNFDAWGRYRNPADWTYNNLPTNPWWLYRGYTAHEHLPEFGLINMNGRMYDPLIGRMLSPDNYVQNPYNTQNHNRYSYVLNNPLRYNDPSGEFINHIVGAIVGGVVGTISGHKAGLRGWALFGFAMANAGIGALSSGVSSGVTSSVAAMPAIAAMSTVATSAISSAAGGLAGGLIAGSMGAAMNGGDFWKGALIGAGTGGLISGATGAIGGVIQNKMIAAQARRDYWNSFIACDKCGVYNAHHLSQVDVMATKMGRSIGYFAQFGVGAAILGGFGYNIGIIRDSKNNWGLFLNAEGRIGYGGGIGLDFGQAKPTHNGQFLLDHFNGLGANYEGGISSPLGGYGVSYGGTLDESLNGIDRMNPKNFGNSLNGYTTGTFSKGYTTPTPKVSAGGWYGVGKTWVFKF